jgi:glycosyltransferase involved in cell wall biosynthesis
MSTSDTPSAAAAAQREPITGFVVAFNEEDKIEECLRSLSFCDELLVVDSFSTDLTVEIARACGARVIQRAWKGYRDQKSFALTQTSHEWVISIDADERVSGELQESILKVLREEWRIRNGGGKSRAEGYAVNRLVYHLGRWWSRGGWYPEYRIRFFRKPSVSWVGTEPHEKVLVNGRVERLSGDLFHYSFRNLDDQLSKAQKFASLAAAEAFREGRRAGLWSLIVRPVARTAKFLLLKRGFREGRAGLIVAVIEGYSTFIKYSLLWEMRLNAKRESAAAVRQPEKEVGQETRKEGSGSV